MPVATKVSRQDELAKYQRLVDEQTFEFGQLNRVDLGNSYESLGVAEAVAVYPEEAMIYALGKKGVITLRNAAEVKKKVEEYCKTIGKR